MARTGSLLAATFAALCFCQAPAHALASRAWVSGHGTDAAGCGGVGTPCRSFQYVHDNIIAAGGEIDVLDPAGYGAIIITKALSIINEGVGTAGVQATATSAIVVNAQATDAVTLRGLTVYGGINGILFQNGKSLIIENCVVRRMTGTGIYFNSTTTGALSVSNTVVSDNGDDGVKIQPQGSAGATATLTRVEVSRNGLRGILVDSEFTGGTPTAVVYDSVVTGNQAAGVEVFYQPGPPGFAAPSVLVVHSVIAANQTGVDLEGQYASATLGQTTFSGNVAGVVNNGGFLSSYGDNYPDGITFATPNAALTPY